MMDDFIKIIEDKVDLINTNTDYTFHLCEDLDKNSNNYASNLIFHYITFKTRSIPENIKFKVELSNEAKLSLDNLSDYYKECYEDVYSLLSEGGDLKPYQSRNLADINTDYILFNHGINHLHLEKEQDFRCPYLKKRSKYVLLFICINDIFYIIDIVNHPRGKEWMVKKYLEIVVNNWPFICDNFKFRSVTGVSNNRSDEEIYQLSKAGIFQSFEVNGDLYFPPGGGISTAKTSFFVRDCADKILNYINSLQNLIDTYNFEELGFSKQNNLMFKLKEDNEGYLYLYEESENKKILINPSIKLP